MRTRISCSFGTKLQIFNNPYDLDIKVAQSGSEGGFSFCLTRGPQNKYRVLLTRVDFSDSLQQGAQLVGELLKGIIESVTSASQSGVPDSSEVLTQGTVDRVVADILKTGMASTYQYEVARKV